MSRCLKPLENVKVHEVDTFADGSQTGYGAVSYLRSVEINVEVSCSFLIGKGYLAKERRTVLQMELLAAVLAVRLDQFLRRELTLPVVKSCIWSDSTAILHSICNRKKLFPVFVANRLVEIERNTNPDLDWKYVPTDQNPADEVTKNFSIKRILDKGNWFCGHDFYRCEEDSWPDMSATGFAKGTDGEKQDLDTNCVSLPLISTITASGMPPAAVDQLINHFSSLHRLKRATSWLLKFCYFVVAKSLKQRFDKLQYLALKDTKLAEKQLIRYEQRRCLPKLCNALTTGKSLTKLNCQTALWKSSPLLWNNLIVMENRLRNAPAMLGAKYTILLPCDSHLIERIVEQMHEACGHYGVNHVFSERRQRF